MIHSTRVALGASLLTVAAVALACRSSPTAVAVERIDGVFPLSVWKGLALPVNSPALPPDTCTRQLDSGSLTLNASIQTFIYMYQFRNCRGFVDQTQRTDGTFVQSGSSIDFNIPGYGRAADIHFAGQILSDRIVVSNWDSPLEFRRPGG